MHLFIYMYSTEVRSLHDFMDERKKHQRMDMVVNHFVRDYNGKIVVEYAKNEEEFASLLNRYTPQQPTIITTLHAAIALRCFECRRPGKLDLSYHDMNGEFTDPIIGGEKLIYRELKL